MELFEAVDTIAHGGGEEVGDVGAGAIVSAFGGRVAEEEARGLAEVGAAEGEGPVDLAGAEGREVGGPADGVEEADEGFAEDGVRELEGEGEGVVEGALFPFGGHAFAGGVIAPMVGVFRAVGGRDRS